MLAFLRRLLGGHPGFEVSTRGRGELVYTEGDRSLRIEAEMLTGSPDWVVYTDSIRRWEPPYEKEPISPERKGKVIANIRSHFRDKGLYVEMEQRPTIPPWNHPD